MKLNAAPILRRQERDEIPGTLSIAFVLQKFAYDKPLTVRDVEFWEIFPMDAIIKRGQDLAIDRPVPASWQSMSRQVPAIVAADQRKALRRLTDLPGYLVVEGQT